MKPLLLAATLFLTACSHDSGGPNPLCASSDAWGIACRDSNGTAWCLHEKLDCTGRYIFREIESAGDCSAGNYAAPCPLPAE